VLEKYRVMVFFF